MFDSTSLNLLALSGIGGASPLAAAAQNSQTPEFNISLPGFDKLKAQQSYIECMSKGGTSDSCGLSATQAALPAGTQTSPAPSSGASILDSAKCWLNAWTIEDIKKCSGGTKTGADSVNNGSSIFGDLSKLATIAIGIIFIAGAVFLLRSPISIVTDAAGKLAKGE